MLTLNSGSKFSEIQVHIDLKDSTLSIGLTHSIHEIKYTKHCGFNQYFG